jgi:hypothetical protein
VTRILHSLPFFDTERVFYFDPQERFITLLPGQIPIRISLGIYLPHESKFSRAATSFPAILDTGFTGDLAISTFHLAEWAKIEPSYLGERLKPPAGREKETLRGYSFQRIDSRFYFRPNRPGTWDADGTDYEFPARILLANAQQDEWRFPLIGTRALRRLRLSLLIDYERLLVNL